MPSVPSSSSTLSLLHWATEGEPVPSGTTLQIAVHLLQICNALSVLLRVSLLSFLFLSAATFGLFCFKPHWITAFFYRLALSCPWSGLRNTFAAVLWNRSMNDRRNQHPKNWEDFTDSCQQNVWKDNLARAMCGDTFASVELVAGTMDTYKDGRWGSYADLFSGPVCVSLLCMCVIDLIE